MEYRSFLLHSNGGNRVRPLIDNSSFDALVNVPLTSARTPLGWAALYGQADAMKALLDAGADPRATDLFGCNSNLTRVTPSTSTPAGGTIRLPVA